MEDLQRWQGENLDMQGMFGQDYGSLETTLDRLDNWKRCVMSGRFGTGRCMSLEGRYRPPPMYDYPTLRADPDLKDGYRVESVIVGITFPKKYREMLKFAYLYPGYDFRSQCRKIGIRATTEIYESTLRMAQLMVHNRIK